MGERETGEGERGSDVNVRKREKEKVERGKE